MLKTTFLGTVLLLFIFNSFVGTTGRICPFKRRGRVYYFQVNGSVPVNYNCSITIIGFFDNLFVKHLNLGENDFLKIRVHRNDEQQYLQWINNNTIENKNVTLQSQNVTVFIHRGSMSLPFHYNFELHLRPHSGPTHPTQPPHRNKSSLCEEILSVQQRSASSFTLRLDTTNLPSKFHIDHNHLSDRGSAFLLCHWTSSIPPLTNYPFNITITKITPIIDFSPDKLSMNFTYRNRTHPVHLIKSTSFYLAGNSRIIFNFLINSTTAKSKFSFLIYGNISSRSLNCSNMDSHFQSIHHVSQFSPHQTHYTKGQVVKLLCQEGFYYQTARNTATCKLTGVWSSFSASQICRASCYFYDKASRKMKRVVRHQLSGIIYSPDYPRTFRDSDVDNCTIRISQDMSMEIGLITSNLHLSNADVQIRSLSTDRSFTISRSFKSRDPFDLLLGNEVEISLMKKNELEPFEIKFQINYTTRNLKPCSMPSVKYAEVIRSDLGHLKGYKLQTHCHKNFAPHTPSVSICKSGGWTPDPPRCLLQCVPSVDNLLVVNDNPVSITENSLNYRHSNSTNCVWKLQTKRSEVDVLEVSIDRCGHEKFCHGSAQQLEIVGHSSGHFQCNLLENQNDNCSRSLFLYSNSILKLKFASNAKQSETNLNITIRKISIVSRCTEKLPEFGAANVKYTINGTEMMLSCKDQGLIVIGSRKHKCRIKSNGTVVWSPKIQANCVSICNSHQKNISLSKENPTQILLYESLSSSSKLNQRDCNFKIIAQKDMEIVVKLEGWNLKSTIYVRRLDNGELITKMNYFQGAGKQITCKISCQIEFTPLVNSRSMGDQTVGKLEINIQPQDDESELSRIVSSTNLGLTLSFLILLVTCLIIGGMVYHNQYYYPYTGWVSKLRNSVITITQTNQGNREAANQIEELAHYNPPLSAAESKMNEFKERNKTFHLRRSMPPNSLTAAKKLSQQKRREALLRRSSDITEQIKVVAGLPNENIDSDDVFAIEETCVDDLRTEMTDISFTLSLSTVSETDSQQADECCENAQSDEESVAVKASNQSNQ